MKRTIFLFAFLGISVLVLANDEPKVKVIAVIDGNTIEILDNAGERTRILLHGIDSPDPGQNYATEAKQLLESLLLNKHVTVSHKGKDRWGNRLAVVSADNMPDPRRELVRKGFAWTTEQNEELENLKEHAREQGIGLWNEENPTPPWLYRRQQSMLQPKIG